MKYNDLINDLLELLDRNEDILALKELKKKLLQDEKLITDIENYKFLKTIDAKKKLYENRDYVEYLQRETNIHLLMKEIKSKFSIFHSRKCHHESN